MISEENKMKVYIAAPFVERKGKAKEAQEAFRAAGHEVVSTWIDIEGGATKDDLADYSHSDLKDYALRDVEDLIEANMLVVINEEGSGGGMHVETGIAIATLKAILIVGGRTNIFHYLNIPRLDTIEEAVEEAGKWTAITDEWTIVSPGAVRGVKANGATRESDLQNRGENREEESGSDSGDSGGVSDSVTAGSSVQGSTESDEGQQ